MLLVVFGIAVFASGYMCLVKFSIDFSKRSALSSFVNQLVKFMCDSVWLSIEWLVKEIAEINESIYIRTQ